jgi:hypothetical protein
MLKAAPNIQVGASQILTGLEAISAPTRVPGAGPLSRRKCGLRAAPGDAIDEVPVFICQPVYLLWSSILAAGGLVPGRVPPVRPRATWRGFRMYQRMPGRLSQDGM